MFRSPSEASFALPQKICLVLAKFQVFEKLILAVDTYSFKFGKCVEIVFHEQV